MSPLDGIVRVVADSDLDGLMAAAVLKASKPEIEVHFAHPALLRSGTLDHLIDRQTAICDLPFHEDCGLYLDHHPNTKIIDRMAICDLSETGVRSNGYLVTALSGPEAIACCVIHGYIDGTIEDANRPALGASFYANSFRGEDNPYDLSMLATLLDETGGGHANACGCRIQPSDATKRSLNDCDKDYNLEKWLELWSDRDSKMIR